MGYLQGHFFRHRVIWGSTTCMDNPTMVIANSARAHIISLFYEIIHNARVKPPVSLFSSSSDSLSLLPRRSF